jgi:hypothetical protein
MKNLYEITGNVTDINTLLINKAEFDALAADAARWRALRDMECAMVPPDRLSYYIENYDKLDAHISNVNKASEAMKGEAK